MTHLLGISGTNGAGKDTIGEILVKHGWFFVSVTRDMLRVEAKKRNLPIERHILREISAEWRREYGLGVLVDKAVAEFKGARGDYKGLAIASLRNSGEADRVHELDGKIIWVDADPKVRFERVMKRKRGTEDAKTYEQFLAEQAAEMTHEGDEATLDIAVVKAKSDIFVENSGKMSDFAKELEKTLSL